MHAPVFYVSWLPFGYNALTIPPMGIFIKHEHQNNKALLMHELVHWMQYKRDGLINFLINYQLYNIHFGYDLNPYELEARFMESEFCKYNYTYCVRCGLANTVRNSNFRL